MFKRYAALLAIFALMIVVLVPASAMAATITKTATYNGDTNLKMIVTYTPGSSDYISSVYASEVSTAKAYRYMQCEVLSQSVYRKFNNTTPVGYVFSQTKTWYPGVYVSGGWNSTSVAFFAGTYSWIQFGYRTLVANNL